MGVPNGVLKLVYSGLLASGAERWACSLWFNGYTDIGGSSGTSYDGTHESTGTAYVAWRTAMLQLMRPEDSMQQVDAYFYSGGVATQHATAPAVHAGAGSVNTMPTQVAAVMTLRTALATRSGRGRIYLPARAVGVTPASGLFSGTLVNTAVDTLASWFTAQKAAGFPAVVVSQTHGTFQPITTVDADGRPDIQRRRANKLVSTRHSAAV